MGVRSNYAVFLCAIAGLSWVVEGAPSTSPVKQFTLISEPAGVYTVGWCPGSKYHGDEDTQLTKYTVADGECVCAFVTNDEEGNKISCPAGYFCPYGTNETIECKPGFYCPGDIAQPGYCCAGYYCPTPTEMYICPEGHYCRTGFVEPIDCPGISKCDEGSTDATKFGAIIVTMVVILGLYVGFEVKTWHDTKVKNIIKLALDDVHEKKTEEAASEEQVTVKSVKIPEEKIFNIEFIGLGCTLPNGVNIMKGVTGAFKAGRMCAVMGPSGAGKTTVITLITGKFKKTAGKILINDKEEEGLMYYKKLTGFVPQEDVMHRTLTVFDNLFHSAKMRLPADLKIADIKSLVLNVIEDLGMSHVTFSIIGDESERGISGGQRKRVNIGLELVADPYVLFLDEPTSGLDSATSYELCKTLRALATNKMLNVNAVIHSPSQKSFFQFTDLLLLGKGGQTVFMGPLDVATKYFSSIGFPLPEGENPADFFLDVTSGTIPRVDDPNFEWNDLFGLWTTHSGDLSCSQPPSHSINATAGVKVALYDKERSIFSLEVIKGVFVDLLMDVKMWFVNRKDDIVNLFQGIVDLVKGVKDPVRETVNPGWQFIYLVMRAAIQVFRNRNTFMSDCLVHFMIGFFVSLTASELEYIGPTDSTVCDVSPLWLQSVCNQAIKDAYAAAGNFLNFGIGFAAIAAAIPTFGDEKVVYWRESASGMSTMSYFLAKWLVDHIRIFFSALFFWMSFYLNYPYEGKPHHVFEVVLLPYYAAWTIGYAVSILAPRESASLIGVVVALLFAMRLSGTNDPTLKEIKDYDGLERAPYDISFPRYGVEAFYVSAVRFYEHVPLGYYNYVPDDPITLFEGTKARQEAYKVNGTESIWMNIGGGLSAAGYDTGEYNDDLKGMFWSALAWGLIAYICMALTNNDKKK